MPKISESNILIIATDGYEKSELKEPLQALTEKGALVEIASPGNTMERHFVKAWNGEHAGWDGGINADVDIGEVNVDDYDALLIPGGVMNPDKLRAIEAAVKVVKNFVAAGKPVAAICHGPWMLVEADVLRGRKATSWPTLRTDMLNAGADWVDEEVVSDNGLITSRKPDDIPAFVAKLMEEIEGGTNPRASAASTEARTLH